MRRTIAARSIRSSTAFGCFLWLLVPFVAGQEAPDPSLNAHRFGAAFNGAETFRTNLCPRAQQVILGEIPLDRALQDVEIHPVVSVGEFANFDYDYDSNGNAIPDSLRLNEDFPGLVPLLLDEICARAGCTWRNSYATVVYTDWPSNQTFTDLLVWATELYDLTADWWMRTAERLETGATFTEQWYDGTVIMVTKQQDEGKDAFDPWGWLAPFDAAVWLMTIVTIFGSTALHYVLVYLSPKGNVRKLNAIETLWQYATAYAGQFEFDPHTTSLRLLTFSMAFWALLMISTYTANLASFLVIKNKSGVDIQTLEDAVSLDLPMCVWLGTGTDDTISKAFPTYAYSSGRLKRKPQREVFTALQSGECEIAITEITSWDIFSTDADINGDCSLAQIGAPFQPAPASFGVKGDAGTLCTSLLRDVFDYHLHNMEVDGTIDELWDRHKEEVGTVDCTTDEEVVRRNRRRMQRLDQTTSSSNSRMNAYNSQKQQPSRQLSSSRLDRSLKAVAKATGGDGDGESKLSLTNMGGVFLFHGLLCGTAFFIAFIPWVYKVIKYKRLPVKKDTKKDVEKSPRSSQYRRESMRASRGGRQARKKRRKEQHQDDMTPIADTADMEFEEDDEADESEIMPRDEASAMDHQLALVPNYDNEHGYESHESSDLDDLRIEMNAKLGTVQRQQAELHTQQSSLIQKLDSIEEKLSALLSTQQQQPKGNGHVEERNSFWKGPVLTA